MSGFGFLPARCSQLTAKGRQGAGFTFHSCLQTAPNLLELSRQHGEPAQLPGVPAVTLPLTLLL